MPREAPIRNTTLGASAMILLAIITTLLMDCQEPVEGSTFSSPPAYVLENCDICAPWKHFVFKAGEKSEGYDLTAFQEALGLRGHGWELSIDERSEFEAKGGRRFIQVVLAMKEPLHGMTFRRRILLESKGTDLVWHLWSGIRQRSILSFDSTASNFALESATYSLLSPRLTFVGSEPLLESVRIAPDQISIQVTYEESIPGVLEDWQAIATWKNGVLDTLEERWVPRTVDGPYGLFWWYGRKPSSQPFWESEWKWSDFYSKSLLPRLQRPYDILFLTYLFSPVASKMIELRNVKLDSAYEVGLIPTIFFASATDSLGQSVRFSGLVDPISDYRVNMDAFDALGSLGPLDSIPSNFRDVLLRWALTTPSSTTDQVEAGELTIEFKTLDGGNQTAEIKFDTVSLEHGLLVKLRWQKGRFYSILRSFSEETSNK